MKARTGDCWVDITIASDELSETSYNNQQFIYVS